jgi:hypothetical protein
MINFIERLIILILIKWEIKHQKILNNNILHLRIPNSKMPNQSSPNNIKKLLRQNTKYKMNSLINGKTIWKVKYKE